MILSEKAIKYDHVSTGPASTFANMNSIIDGFLEDVLLEENHQN